MDKPTTEKAMKYMPYRRQMSKRKSNQKGFSVIELLIVLAVSSMIIMIVFLAINTTQRRSRNQRREADAKLLALAIRECLQNNLNKTNKCNSPAKVNFDTSRFSIYTGYHWGATPGPNPQSAPPTIDEPNWFFGLQCAQRDDPGPFKTVGVISRAFVVAYVIENPGGIKGGIEYRCLDG